MSVTWLQVRMLLVDLTWCNWFDLILTGSLGLIWFWMMILPAPFVDLIYFLVEIWMMNLPLGLIWFWIMILPAPLLLFWMMTLPLGGSYSDFEWWSYPLVWSDFEWWSYRLPWWQSWTPGQACWTQTGSSSALEPVKTNHEQFFSYCFLILGAVQRKS